MSEKEKTYSKEPSYTSYPPKQEYQPKESYQPTYQQQPYQPTYQQPYQPPYQQTYPPSYSYPYKEDNLDLPNGEIKGYFKAWAEDTDRDANRVLELKRDWYLCCEWSISGTAVVAFGGTFHLTGVAEDIGGPDDTKNTPDEVKLFEDDVPVSDAEPGKTRSYKLDIRVPAGAIPADGAYKVVVLMTHSNAGKSGKEHFTRLAGIVEIPMLQFYSFEG